MTERTAEEIREGLADARKMRDKGEALVAEGTSNLKQWLAVNEAAEAIPVSEAARLGGVSRKTVYEMLPEKAS